MANIREASSRAERLEDVIRAWLTDTPWDGEIETLFTAFQQDMEACVAVAVAEATSEAHRS